MKPRFDLDRAKDVLAQFADGEFGELFETQWRSLDAFARASFDYIPASDRDAFLDALTAPKKGARWYLEESGS